MNIPKLDINNGNLFLVDLNNPIEINKEWIKTKAKWSAFENMYLFGDIQYLFKDGKTLIKRGILEK